ncbi:hypothetical protein [Saccharopolyspora sp. CA-218241]|uniref:hypothetical protein n=1 Tax=Saccharopolyspora sp. CA-218241 TaxID=3240027 RepID=UPI003D9699D5
MTEVSENVKAFRNRMAGLVAENSASASAVRQRWQESAAEADKNSAERIEKAQKLAERIAERTQALRKAQEKEAAGFAEISVRDDYDEDDVDPEVERFSQGILAQQPKPEPTEAAGTAQQSAQQSAPQPGEAPRHARPEPARPEPAGWGVQAGRFGRRAEPEPPPAPPRAQPKPAPRPAPRRPAAYDDEEDFEERKWLD